MRQAMTRYSCVLALQVVGSNQNAVSECTCRRAPHMARAVVAELAVGIVVHGILAPIPAQARVDIDRWLSLGVHSRRNFEHDLIELARRRSTQMSEKSDVAALRLKRRKPREMSPGGMLTSLFRLATYLRLLPLVTAILALRQLAEGKVLILAPNDGNIWAANPVLRSAFTVSAGNSRKNLLGHLHLGRARHCGRTRYGRYHPLLLW
jgi:hypothetical protein